MAAGHIFLDSGMKREGKTRFRSSGTTPKADTLDVYPGETLGEITLRAYGANTQNNRDKLMRANAKLEGQINVPR